MDVLMARLSWEVGIFLVFRLKGQHMDGRSDLVMDWMVPVQVGNVELRFGIHVV